MPGQKCPGFHVNKQEAHLTQLEWNEGRPPGGSSFFQSLSTYIVPLNWVGCGFPIHSVFRGVVPLEVLPGANTDSSAVATWPTVEETRIISTCFPPKRCQNLLNRALYIGISELKIISTYLNVLAICFLILSWPYSQIKTSDLMLWSLESQGLGSLVGCRLWGRTESDMTEAT